MKTCPLESGPAAFSLVGQPGCLSICSVEFFCNCVRRVIFTFIKLALWASSNARCWFGNSVDERGGTDTDLYVGQ